MKIVMQENTHGVLRPQEIWESREERDAWVPYWKRQKEAEKHDATLHDAEHAPRLAEPGGPEAR